MFKMTKASLIDNHVIYTKDKTVKLCFSYISKVFKNFNVTDMHWIDVRTGNGSFYKYLEGLSRDAYDPLGNFKEAIIGSYLRIEHVRTDKPYVFTIGFPDVREYEQYIKKGVKLGVDFMAFITPISGGNKKNRVYLKQRGYSILFNEQLPVDSFYLHNGDEWDQNLNFIIISKNKYLEHLYTVVQPKLTYNDIFDVHTINTSTIKIKETTHPWLFANNRMPWSKKHNKYYPVYTDENGIKYYNQDGINLDKIGKCDLYLPLRFFPASNDRFEFHSEFNEKMFGKIGFGLKVKDGYKLKSNFTKNLYIIYKETFKGVFTQIAVMNEDTIRSFYEMKRYNNGLYICSIKLIKRSKIGIKK